ncbi:MAG TPA: YggT family protein [Burkholderiales bacterium]|nr:YggT family protein [Burkholderiales bacterium]
MLQQIVSIMVDFVGGFFVLMVLLRFYFQWLRVPFRNQVGEFLVATTNWMVKPARRVIPALFGLDLASLLCAWILQAALLALLLMVNGYDLTSAPGIAAATLFAQALVDLLQLSVKILLFAVILQAALSWINPHNPMQFVLDSITRPMLRPIRRFVPPIANVDLSPLILILVLLVLLVPIAELRRMAGGLF